MLIYSCVAQCCFQLPLVTATLLSKMHCTLEQFQTSEAYTQMRAVAMVKGLG